MKFYTYILYSPSIDRFYVGHTGEPLDERLRKHNLNNKGFTGKANDRVVVYAETYNDKSSAFAKERACY